VFGGDRFLPWERRKSGDCHQSQSAQGFAHNQTGLGRGRYALQGRRPAKKGLDEKLKNTGDRKVIPRPHRVFKTIICLPIF
jgi:hypothetical protein